MHRRRYPTDLNDAEWERLAPLLLSTEPRGRPREHPVREIFDAIFYVVREGCPCLIEARVSYPLAAFATRLEATGTTHVIGYPSPQSGMNVRSGLGLPCRRGAQLGLIN